MMITLRLRSGAACPLLPDNKSPGVHQRLEYVMPVCVTMKEREGSQQRIRTARRRDRREGVRPKRIARSYVDGDSYCVIEVIFGTRRTVT